MEQKIFEFDPRCCSDKFILYQIGNYLYDIGISPKNYTDKMSIVVRNHENKMHGILTVFLNQQKLEITSSNHKSGDYEGLIDDLFRNLQNCITNSEAIAKSYDTSKKQHEEERKQKLQDSLYEPMSKKELDEMLHNKDFKESPYLYKWCCMQIRGKYGYFTDNRVSINPDPDNLYMYHIAGDDQGHEYSYYYRLPRIEPIENDKFRGTFVSTEPLPIDDYPMRDKGNIYARGFYKYNIKYEFNEVYDTLLDLKRTGKEYPGIHYGDPNTEEWYGMHIGNISGYFAFGKVDISLIKYPLSMHSYYAYDVLSTDGGITLVSWIASRNSNVYGTFITTNAIKEMVIDCVASAYHISLNNKYTLEDALTGITTS
jgi:hypothetical protein